jgi:CBS domain-containing protein
MGWPREGAAAAIPNAGEVARKETPTCLLDDRIGDVREKVLAMGTDACIVVNSEGIVQGRLKVAALSENPDVTAEEAMEIGPTTVRPNEALEPLVDRMRKRNVRSMVVTDLRGKLLGLLYRDDAERALAIPR